MAVRARTIRPTLAALALLTTSCSGGRTAAMSTDASPDEGADTSIDNGPLGSCTVDGGPGLACDLTLERYCGTPDGGPLFLGCGTLQATLSALPPCSYFETNRAQATVASCGDLDVLVVSFAGVGGAQDIDYFYSHDSGNLLAVASFADIADRCFAGPPCLGTSFPPCAAPRVVSCAYETDASGD